jgi:hypothetical protein
MQPPRRPASAAGVTRLPERRASSAGLRGTPPATGRPVEGRPTSPAVVEGRAGTPEGIKRSSSSEGRTPASDGKAKRDSAAGGGVSSVVVAVRVRPLPAVSSQSPSMRCGATSLTLSPGKSETRFNFDLVFGEDVTQEAVYAEVGAPILRKALQGFNATIFACATPPSNPNPVAARHLRTSAPPHLRTSAPPHLRTSAPPYLRTSAPPQPRNPAPSPCPAACRWADGLGQDTHDDG